MHFCCKVERVLGDRIMPDYYTLIKEHRLEKIPEVKLETVWVEAGEEENKRKCTNVRLFHFVAKDLVQMFYIC